jgi:hypothetical protein
MGSSAAVYSKHLSNFAFGLYQDLGKTLVRFIAPEVPTGIGHGQFKMFDDKNAFQIHDTLRALGGENRLIEFAATDPFFNLKPRGLRIGIDDKERTDAGDYQTALEEAKVKTLVSSSVISHENDVYVAALAGLTPVSGAGVWSNTTVDPIEELDVSIAAIATATGTMPNRMVFDLASWVIFRNHPLVKARAPIVSPIGVTPSQAAMMTINPGIDIRVGVLSKDTKKFGAARNVTSIMGGNVLIFFSQDSPTQYDPSFMKTFCKTAAMVDSVFQYRDEDRNSDMYKTNWEDDLQVISTLLAARILLS